MADGIKHACGSCPHCTVVDSSTSSITRTLMALAHAIECRYTSKGAQCMHVQASCRLKW